MKNEIRGLPAFWESIEKQTIFHNTEIIFLDSGSTDGSFEFLSNKPCAVYSLKGPFNFGKSCNQIAALASGSILVFLSAHVVLQQADALEQIAKLLEEHPGAAAYLRQIPNTVLGYSAYEAANLAWRFRSGRVTVRLNNSGDGFSNAASAITRAAWLHHPFMEVHGSEDFLWARQHLQSGGKLFYLPQLQVMHSHNESAEQLYRRVRLNVQARAQTGSYWKSVYLFVGVYVSMRRIGASHNESLRYASAHARAYL